MPSEEKAAITAGASQGIGAGPVQAYRKPGYAVVASSRHITPSSDPGVLAVPGDVAGPDTAADLLERAVERFARMGTLPTRHDDPAAAPRPLAADRDGLVMAEGADVLTLERTADAKARGARPRAQIAGTGSSADAHHVASPHPEGRGARPAAR
jgi:NAD(P)-dependent dehydrogenase (short-subunit alcohol dehydrogenase family)